MAFLTQEGEKGKKKKRGKGRGKKGRKVLTSFLIFCYAWPCGTICCRGRGKKKEGGKEGGGRAPFGNGGVNHPPYLQPFPSQACAFFILPLFGWKGEKKGGKEEKKRKKGEGGRGLVWFIFLPLLWGIGTCQKLKGKKKQEREGRGKEGNEPEQVNQSNWQFLNCVPDIVHPRFRVLKLH